MIIVSAVYGLVACTANPKEDTIETQNSQNSSSDSIEPSTNGSQEPDETKKPAQEESDFTKMYNLAKTSYKADNNFTISGKGKTDKVYCSDDGKIIYLLSLVDVDSLDKNGKEVNPPEYDVKGSFSGQIYNLTKGSILNLRGADISNVDAPAIYSEKRIEISSKDSTENKITVTVSDPKYDKESNKIGAVYAKKKLEIGGSGNLTIISSFFHGVKAEDVQIKGSGKIYIHTEADSNAESGFAYADGSGINCAKFQAKAPKVTDIKFFNISFAGFKHGIKADELIEIQASTFDFSNVNVPFKTDTQKNDPGKEHKIVISKERDSDVLKFILSDAKQKELIISDCEKVDISAASIEYKNQNNGGN